jgi:hypothetical protein
MAVEEDRVPIVVTELGEEVLQRRVAGIVKRLELLLEGGDPERARKDGRIARCLTIGKGCSIARA